VASAARTLLALSLLASVACSANEPPLNGNGGPTGNDGKGNGGVEVSRWSERQACGLPRPWLERIADGYRADRSGEVQIVPQTFSYFGNHSHSGPWPFLQRVPMLFYGPGHVPETGSVSDPATMADLAPTLGALVGFDFDAPDGAVLQQAVLPDQQPPKLVLTIVWDGGGRNVLEEWPDAWPTLRELIEGGIWFENFTVGSSPSVTPAVHTSLGTGALPDHHGIVDLRFKVDGELSGARGNLADYILEPALTDLFDREHDNVPVIGMVGSGGTLGMIGHGSAFEGGDMDIAAGQTQDEWVLGDQSLRFYKFPGYVNDIGGLEELVRRFDQQDGQQDGAWLGEPIPEDLSETPAFAPYQTEVIREVIEREGFGRDDVPDFLFVNYKQIDKVGHRFSMSAPQMEDVVRSSDDALADLLRLLNREVGRGEWVLSLTADHGSMPDTSVTGGFVIDIQDLYADLLARFDADGDDRPAIQSARVTQIWVDEAELEEGGFTVEDVARFLSAYTEGDNLGEGTEPVFKAAFPGDALRADLRCLAA
jgi:hypothetical protein